VSVFIDRQGRVQEYVKGGLLTEEKIDEVVARIQGLERATSALFESA
jgi:predicted transcriptional regulator